MSVGDTSEPTTGTWVSAETESGAEVLQSLLDAAGIEVESQLVNTPNFVLDVMTDGGYSEAQARLRHIIRRKAELPFYHHQLHLSSSPDGWVTIANVEQAFGRDSASYYERGREKDLPTELRCLVDGLVHRVQHSTLKNTGEIITEKSDGSVRILLGRTSEPEVFNRLKKGLEQIVNVSNQSPQGFARQFGVELDEDVREIAVVPWHDFITANPEGDMHPELEFGIHSDGYYNSRKPIHFSPVETIGGPFGDPEYWAGKLLATGFVLSNDPIEPTDAQDSLAPQLVASLKRDLPVSVGGRSVPWRDLSDEEAQELFTGALQQVRTDMGDYGEKQDELFEQYTSQLMAVAPEADEYFSKLSDVPLIVGHLLSRPETRRPYWGDCADLYRVYDERKALQSRFDILQLHITELIRTRDMSFGGCMEVFFEQKEERDVQKSVSELLSTDDGQLKIAIRSVTKKTKVVTGEERRKLGLVLNDDGLPEIAENPDYYLVWRGRDGTLRKRQYTGGRTWPTPHDRVQDFSDEVVDVDNPSEFRGKMVEKWLELLKTCDSASRGE